MKKTRKTSDGKSAPREQQEFPGYPKYPATEDIVNRAKRVEMDLDGEQTTPPPSSGPAVKAGKSPSDVTPDDLQALNSEENKFEGDDAVLEGRAYPVDFTGQDLDVPGTELDDARELVGNEDEENNIYSLGGENHEDLEEDRS
jgi:hypothetical protein